MAPITKELKNADEEQWTCEYCNHVYNTKHSFTDPCRSSFCAVENRDGSLWQCPRCGAQYHHKRSAANHMSGKCWEKCGECAEGGLDKCDAYRVDGDCENCRMRGVTCMKRTQGQATDGMLLEITSTSDGHGDRLQVRQQQTSRSPSEQRSQLGQAVQTKPTLDQANQTDSGEKKIDDTRSRGAHMISPNNREEPDDHGTSAQSASLQDQHATDVEMTDFINLIKVDAHYESSATASATDSPNILSQPGDGQHITEAVLRVQNNHQARSPPNLFLNIATAPSHPQAQGNSARDLFRSPTVSRPPTASALSPVDKAFLSSSENDDPRLRSFTTSKSPSQAPSVATSTSPVNPMAATPSNLAEPQIQQTPTQPRLEYFVSPVPFPRLVDGNNHHPKHEANNRSPPSQPRDPLWFTTVPEIASMLSFQRSDAAPDGLSNDFTADYAHMLAATEVNRRNERHFVDGWQKIGKRKMRDGESYGEEEVNWERAYMRGKKVWVRDGEDKVGDEEKQNEDARGDREEEEVGDGDGDGDETVAKR